MYLSMHDVMISLGACARRMSFAQDLVSVGDTFGSSRFVTTIDSSPDPIFSGFSQKSMKCIKVLYDCSDKEYPPSF